MPLEGRCLYYALLGLTQAPGFAGGHDLYCKQSVNKVRVLSFFVLLFIERAKVNSYETE